MKIHISEVCMKSIKKKNNSFWMIGSFLIILMLFLLLLSQTPISVTKDTIDISEVTAFIEALGDDTQKKEDYERLKEKYTRDGKTGDTTYGMLGEALDILDVTGTLSVQILDNVSKSKVIERDEFFLIYEKLIDEVGKRNEIALEKVAILGIAKETDEAGESILVTENETGTCDGRFFSEYQGVVAETYVKRNEQGIRYIAVKESVDEKIKLPYLYVKGQDVEGLHFQVHGVEIVLPYSDNVEISNDEVASLVIEKGKVEKAETFDEKINGKVLAVNETYVTLENIGKIEFAENMKIYKVFEGLSEGSIADVALGYEFVDFVIDSGKICACLIVANDGMENIRVLIKTTDFASSYHESLSFTCDSGYKVYKNGEEYKQCNASDEIFFSKDDLKTDDMIKIVPDILSGKITVKSIKRNQGIPSYGGVMELHKKEEGIVLINELLLEEYLYTVVPSEMPSYYPEQALMAQAVCARTYAYTKMQNAGLKALGAHLDDSTSFQVYNNIDAQVSTTNAVRQTVGQIVTSGGSAVETMYYSTSCGLGSTGIKLNKTDQTPADLTSNADFTNFISNTNETDYEANEAFYRWNYETILNTELLEKRIKECYNKNKNNVLYLDSSGQFSTVDEFENIGEIKDIFVAERTSGGRAEKVAFRGSKNTVMVCGEYQIRYVLLNQDKVIYKQDGTNVNMSALLPSAFVEIETGQNDGSVIRYSVVGGGYGHGNGMSQNGAGNMARDGYTYMDILTLFYENCTIEPIY